MLNDLFLNGAIVIAVISLGNQLLIEHDISPSATWKLKIFFSTMAGILGILLMVNSVQIMPGVILDFRNIAVILSAIYCGFLPSIITSLIIGIFRLFYTGISFSSMTGALTAFVIGMVCGFISTLHITRIKKWAYMTSCILVIPAITFSLVISDNTLMLKTVFSYLVSLIIVSMLVYYFVWYIDLSKYTYRKYQLESVRDNLTGLNNVRQFDKQLNRIIASYTAESLITMLFIDVDFFKKVNDTYGHRNGDKVLGDLAKILLSRSSDTDFVYRNGGEEFSVLMTDCPRDKILEVAERIRKAVRDHKFHLLEGQIIHITVSIGVAIYPDSVNDIEQLVEKADEALYEAKRTGRDKVVLFSEPICGKYR